MSEYSLVKGGKLNLKGHKEKKRHKKKRKRVEEHEDSEMVQDIASHDGWWAVEKFDEVTGSVAIEVRPHTYVIALDNGLFTTGPPHDEGEGPNPEEVLTAVRVSDSKVALKSGYGKYLSVEKSGVVAGRSDAIGPREMWEPVFENGKLALLACNSCFLSCTEEDGDLIAKSPKVEANEIIKVRTKAEKQTEKKDNQPDIDKGSVKLSELSYVKMFQSFQDRKLRVNEGDRTNLKKAKEDGSLHGMLLDRREKMKADRYCK
ncbi:PREDICTED: protein FRG1-like [Priapulus caudatus]|uniref:Protein FRG1-like n=1 Tax=Priapulus caudatus TaxID=37621 RepID=A0ABM1EV60_PRICU|nr:PREDICTED: protein FRG1-like [Priapulus caudatus]